MDFRRFTIIYRPRQTKIRRATAGPMAIPAMAPADNEDEEEDVAGLDVAVDVPVEDAVDVAVDVAGLVLTLDGELPWMPSAVRLL